MKYKNSYATMSYMHISLEQGHKNIIADMLCLGMYLGLLGYIDMNNSKQSQYNIDIIQMRFLPLYPLSVKLERSAVFLNYSYLPLINFN